MKKTLLATALFAFAVASASAFTVAESADKNTNVKLGLDFRANAFYENTAKADESKEEKRTFGNLYRFNFSTTAKVTEDVSFGSNARFQKNFSSTHTTTTPKVGKATVDKSHNSAYPSVVYAFGWVKSAQYGKLNFGKYYTGAVANDAAPAHFNQGFSGGYQYVEKSTVNSVFYESPKFGDFSFTVGAATSYKDAKTDYNRNLTAFGTYEKGDHEASVFAFVDSTHKPNAVNAKTGKTESQRTVQASNFGAYYTYNGFKADYDVAFTAFASASNKTAASNDYSTKQGGAVIATYAPKQFKPYDTNFTAGVGAYNEKSYTYKEDTLKTQKVVEFVVGGTTKVYSDKGVNAYAIYEYGLTKPVAATTKEKASNKDAKVVSAEKFDTTNNFTFTFRVTY